MVTEMRGGLLLHNDAIALAIALEATGHVLSVKDGRLLVTQGSRLTPAHRDSIARHRFHLMAIADYSADAWDWKITNTEGAKKK